MVHIVIHLIMSLINFSSIKVSLFWLIKDTYMNSIFSVVCVWVCVWRGGGGGGGGGHSCQNVGPRSPL